MKIVGVDNFNTEVIDDYLVADNIGSERLAKIMANALNEKLSPNNNPDRYFYKVMPDSYKLFKFKP